MKSKSLTASLTTWIMAGLAGGVVFGIAFPGCISGSAQNTNIVVNVPAGGAGTTVAATAWGYTN